MCLFVCLCICSGYNFWGSRLMHFTHYTWMCQLGVALTLMFVDKLLDAGETVECLMTHSNLKLSYSNLVNNATLHIRTKYHNLYIHTSAFVRTFILSPFRNSTVMILNYTLLTHYRLLKGLWQVSGWQVLRWWPSSSKDLMGLTHINELDSKAWFALQQ